MNTTQNLKIGDKVKKNVAEGQTNYMRNGVVTGFDYANNRLLITWPSHGTSSIHTSSIVAETN